MFHKWCVTVFTLLLHTAKICDTDMTWSGAGHNFHRFTQTHFYSCKIKQKA